MQRKRRVAQTLDEKNIRRQRNLATVLYLTTGYHFGNLGWLLEALHLASISRPYTWLSDLLYDVNFRCRFSTGIKASRCGSVGEIGSDSNQD